MGSGRKGGRLELIFEPPQRMPFTHQATDLDVRLKRPQETGGVFLCQSFAFESTFRAPVCMGLPELTLTILMTIVTKMVNMRAQSCKPSKPPSSRLNA